MELLVEILGSKVILVVRRIIWFVKPLSWLRPIFVAQSRQKSVLLSTDQDIELIGPFSFLRFLQPEGVYPVSAPAGLHHLQHVADGGGAGDPGHRGSDQPGQSGEG